MLEITSRMESISTFTHDGLKNTTAQSEGLAITGTKAYDAFGLETASSGTWQTAFGYAGNFGYQKTDAGMKLLGHRSGWAVLSFGCFVLESVNRARMAAQSQDT